MFCFWTYFPDWARTLPRAGGACDHLLERTSVIGPEGFVRDRIAALRESGVTTLNVTPLAGPHAERVALIEKVRDLAC